MDLQEGRIFFAEYELYEKMYGDILLKVLREYDVGVFKEEVEAELEAEQLPGYELIKTDLTNTIKVKKNILNAETGDMETWVTNRLCPKGIFLRPKSRHNPGYYGLCDEINRNCLYEHFPYLRQFVFSSENLGSSEMPKLFIYDKKLVDYPLYVPLKALFENDKQVIIEYAKKYFGEYFKDNQPELKKSLSSLDTESARLLFDILDSYGRS